jgi:hypothetical protein
MFSVLAGGTLNPQRLQRIEECNADIWVLTETRNVISMGDGWHSFSSYPIPDYHDDGETLVTVWSRWAIRPVSASRFTACAEIIIPTLGPFLVYGTVIPWDKDEGFSKQVKPARWEEHRRQVKVQTSEWEVLSKSYPEHLMCIAGDFNQHRDRSGFYKDNDSVKKVSDSMAFCGLRCITENNSANDQLSKPLVDHICLSESLAQSAKVTVYPYDAKGSAKLSDHHLVMAEITI